MPATANIRSAYQCDRDTRHVFYEPGRKPDNTTHGAYTVPCCPKCGSDDYQHVRQCCICGEVLPDGETICGCERLD